MESVKASAEIYAPAGGKVVAVNKGLADKLGDTYELIYSRWLPSQGLELVKGIDFERYDAAAGFFQKVERLSLGPAERAWRQDGEVRRHVGRHRMKFPAESFDEFPSGLTNVGDQCVASPGHDLRIEIIS